ncbi:hypothetical protein OGAPHI_004631 [Ogataea philodendri]|uniref:DUF676 domain-containing protein n=1 Tax=Ogataea philodendri TaxID=1378263 RepID=A0A9P8T3K6_9ASCO|nr:uncharacterized protein OGAPHI_004631 [Ogataea philodendri]KAH3664279.1 hypothetical protein OGAPHI_004631 [Ogataea philodendri]
MESKNCHLVVLCHGLWGVSDHFAYIEAQLRTYSSLNPSDEQLVVYTTKTNERFRTYDGIDLCGTRVAEEILAESLRLQEQGLAVRRFSVVGYSLGGLIARYAIGVLYYRGFFQDIEPVNFTTFCSPHVGVLTPGSGVSIRIFNWLVPILLGKSGHQLFLKDSSVPLLKLMSLPNTVFFRGLAQFKNISLYSNIRSDIRTSWWCSGISYVNPFDILDKNPNVKIDKDGYIHFENGSKFSLKFVPNYEPVILDVDQPITFTGLVDGSSKSNLNQMVQEDLPDDNDADGNAAGCSKTANFFQRKFKWAIMLFKFGVYLPMWVTWFVLHNWLQVINSTVRVVKESSKLHSLLELCDEPEPVSRPPLTKRLSEASLDLNRFESGLHDHGDEFIDSVFDAITSTKDINRSIFDNRENGPLSLTTTIKKLGEFDLATETSKTQDADRYRQILAPFKLDLSPEQKDIIKHLNTLPWHKYPLYITKTNATHAAAIVRHEDPAFEEGKVVVQHFVQHVFEH